MSSRRSRIFGALVVASCLLGGGCSSWSVNRTPAPTSVHLNTPQSVSPGTIAPAPMARTAILPASVMLTATVRAPKGEIQGLSYTQIPGAASAAAAAPDGSLWVLSTQPNGSDKYIWHYSGGSWSNISGLASALSVAPNGTLYAINSGGGAYAYSGGTWSAFGGGCRALAAASDGSLYVISNGGGSDGAIWHYASGTWTQQPGSGNRLASSWDSNSYANPGGTITPLGLYVINSVGSIYYLGSAGYVQLAGAASALVPINGGLFVLGYPTNANGNALYYYDLANPGFSAQTGSGVSISSDGKTLYVVGTSGAIYSSAITHAPVLYVANGAVALQAGARARRPMTTSSNAILAFAQNASGNVGPINSISGGSTSLADPRALALDGSGEIYVADGVGSAVRVYAVGASGNVAPVRTISDSGNPHAIFFDITFDNNGNVATAMNNAFDVFPAGANGSVTPLRRVSASGAQAIRFDTSGNAYVATGYVGAGSQNGVAVFGPSATGTAAPLRTIGADLSKALANPTGVAVDTSNNIYVTNEGSFVGGVDSVTVYAAGASGYPQPLHAISGGNTLLSQPTGITIDPNGTIYVLNQAFVSCGPSCLLSEPQVLAFSTGADGNATPAREFRDKASGDLYGAFGMVIGTDSAGEVFVGGGAHILVFGSTANGDTVTPLRDISGSNTGIGGNGVGAIAVDPAGTVYETNYIADVTTTTINVFSPGANGNATPSRTLTVTPSSLGLSAGQILALTVDGTGHLYVFMTDDTFPFTGVVAVYPPLASGTTAPTSVMTTATAVEENGPEGFALDATGAVSLASEGYPFSIDVYASAVNGGATPARTIRGGGIGPFVPAALGFDASGNLYVGSRGDGTISVYSPGASGTATPLRVLQGLADVDRFFVDGDGTIYAGVPAQMAVVTNIYSTQRTPQSARTVPAAISVFAPGASGLATPARTINGSATQLSAPAGLTLR